MLVSHPLILKRGAMTDLNTALWYGVDLTTLYGCHCRGPVDSGIIDFIFGMWCLIIIYHIGIVTVQEIYSVHLDN